MKLNNIKRIRSEDFESDDQALISKLSFALNPFLEQVSNIFNKNIDFENLNQELISVSIELDVTGVPKTLTQVKSGLKTNVKGLICIKANNLQNDGTFPTNTPFISFSQSGNLITLLNITGIPANKKYNLTLISIG